MMIGASVIIFIIVMYQLLKMIIDKSEKSISILKIFGYENKEIDRIYLGGSLFTILMTLLVSIKLTGYIVKKIYPYMVSNRAAALPVVYTPFLVIMGILLIMVTYFAVMIFLKKHLSQISFSEILRSKE
jgi:putative ABC transport system permease protein